MFTVNSLLNSASQRVQASLMTSRPLDACSAFEEKIRRNTYRFLRDGHWHDTEGDMVVPDLGFLVKTENFEAHSKAMASRYAGCPVVVFSHSYEWEGCWSSWSATTTVGDDHHHCMVVPLCNGELVWEAWSFAPMWAGSKVINVSLFPEEVEEDTEDTEEVSPRFRSRVKASAKEALRKGKKINLAA